MQIANEAGSVFPMTIKHHDVWNWHLRFQNYYIFLMLIANQATYPRKWDRIQFRLYLDHAYQTLWCSTAGTLSCFYGTYHRFFIFWKKFLFALLDEQIKLFTGQQEFPLAMVGVLVEFSSPAHFIWKSDLLILILKAPIRTAAGDKFCYNFLNFRKK